MAAMYLMWRLVKIKMFEDLDHQECSRSFIYILGKVIFLSSDLMWAVLQSIWAVPAVTPSIV